MFNLKYFKSGVLFDFWRKLYEAVEYSPNDELNEDFEYFPHKNTLMGPPPNMKYAVQHVEHSITDSGNVSRTRSYDQNIQTILLRAPDVSELPSLDNSDSATIKNTNTIKKTSVLKKLKDRLLPKKNKQAVQIPSSL